MKIGIIGLGHLGGCLLEGLLKAGHAPASISVYARRREVCDSASEKYGVFASTELETVIGRSETFFIVIKGGGFDELFSSVDKALFNGKTAVSFMAGVKISRVKDMMPGATVVYAIPSIAIATCTGITAYYDAPKPIEDIFASLGHALKVTEDKMDAVTVFASSGVGFAAYLLDAYYRAGLELGFTPDEARTITDITFKNAMDNSDLAATVTAVATKGGITERGVMSMDSAKVPLGISEGVMAAYDKMQGR